MKFIFLSSLIASILTFASGLNAQQAPQKLPKVILHFDVNRTILADDPAGGKTVQDAILHSLADAYKDRWDSRVHAPISYGDYVKEYLLPETSEIKKDKAAKAALKKERNAKVNEFLSYLKANKHPFYAQAQDEFTRMNEKLTKSDSIVFDSFYNAVHHLRSKGIAHTIILRTFGEDLPRVTADINKKLKTEFFKTQGHFKNGKLYVNGVCLETPAQQHAFFKSHESNCAIQDNWHDWDKSGELQEHSKQFAVDLADANVITIFNDDNINPDPASKKNIVNPVDINTGKSLSVHELIKSGNLIVVDTVQAVLDDNYYIKPIERLLNRK